MYCPRCHTENRAGARFCVECGTGLALICPECGTELPPGARFCDACGAQAGALRAEADEERGPPALGDAIQRLVPKEYAERLRASRGQVAPERRTVTILFSDVVGSTALAEDLDPEDVMEIMDGAFDVLIEPVYRYEGTVARLMGDAILAFFGAPIAHEDDPERACRAALDIVAGAQSYAERLEKERGITGFNVRAGIHTGLVVVGEVGTDLRVEYTAMGDAINLASRMESAAGPGTVLITEDTHRLVAPLFETEALGPIEVKGKAAPVRAYRVLAPREVPGKLRGIAGLESPLVGREAELDTLRQAVERLQNGTGGIVTLVGEAGIGKSRLVAEVHSGATHLGGALHLEHVTWVEGRCLSYGASIAYLLWLDVLRGLLGVTLEDGPDDVRGALEERVRALCPEQYDDVYPYLARLMSLPLGEKVQEYLNNLDGRTLRERTFAAVETLLACTAGDQLLILVCEDLHWADPTSLQLLEHLFPLTTRLPLLFLCPFRPVHEHRVWQVRERLAQDDSHAHIDLWLEPLSPDESQTLVSNLLWMEGLPPALKERILSRAEGNPFYLEEILRSLIDQRAIVQDPASGEWQTVTDVEEIAIPDTLEGVLVGRIDRLQEETRHVLQLASVIGRIFLYRVLGAIAAAEAAVAERNLDGELSTLQREELIRERARLPELEYIFKHDLTREAAYNGLLKRQRRAFHRQVAEALEGLFPERIEEQLGLLGHHWARAGDAEKATEYLLRYGDQARLAYAHQEAIEAYERALAFLKEREDHEQAARTLMKLGLTYHNAFQFRKAQQIYREGFALWQQVGRFREEAALAPAPHALRTCWYKLPMSLDPTAMTGDLLSSHMTDQLFSGLVELTPEMDVVPDVARAWEVSEGGRKYVFHLRDDARWSDGRPLTAGDFEYSWKRVLDPTRTNGGDLLDAIRNARAFHGGDLPDPGGVGVQALDPVTLAVELEEPAGYFLHLLAMASTYPVPRHVVEVHGEAWAEVGNIVTNGPFRVEPSKGEDSMTLVRNPHYHGRFTGNLERVEVLADFEDEAAALDCYAAGGLDILHITRFPQSQQDRARQRHAGDLVLAPPLVTVYAAFDASRPPFDDRRVRRALVMAIDRELLFDEISARREHFLALDGFVPPGMPGHSPQIGLCYDPEQARQLLAEAGYRGGRGFPGIDALTASPMKLGAGHLRRQWQENLGIQIEWQISEDWAALVDRWEEQAPQMHMVGWSAGYPDPHSYLGEWLDPTGWRHEVYEALIGRARRVMDQGERMRLYRRADRVLMEEAPIMPLVHVPRLILVKPWVEKFPMAGIKTWLWKDIIIQPH